MLEFFLEHRLNSVEEAVGLDWIQTIVASQRKYVLKKIQECIKNKKLVALDAQHEQGKTTREWCSMVIKPILDNNGEVVNLVGLSRDISDRKKIEEDLKKKIKELARFNMLMIGREVKMVELKKEIARLKRQIEKLENKK